ncbi:piggyBac transposable element-derived protein 4-like [Asterias amurensis]|uniref:piggyBac transposable element-derived protein 4-like n=1 Tax=Asterias amurensis TaxID=7602 RepID=UPI003AB69B5B
MAIPMMLTKVPNHILEESSDDDNGDSDGSIHSNISETTEILSDGDGDNEIPAGDDYSDNNEEESGNDDDGGEGDDDTITINDNDSDDNWDDNESSDDTTNDADSEDGKVGKPAKRQRLTPAQPTLPTTYKAKSGHTWSVDQPSPARLPRSNILREASGPRNIGGATSILEFWKMFFPERILDNILCYTNEQGVRERGRSWVKLVMMELLTVLGLLYFLGLCKAAHDQVRDFWKPGMFARPVCQAAMKADRFQEVLRMMRFDDKATRQQRKATDKFAPIRDVFDEFVNNCQKYFNPGENMTVDDELVAFRGICGFRQYMPQKPARYGIKFWVCTDSTHNYVTNIQPYLGKENQTKLGKRVVLDMVRPLFKTGRNITTDNHFTSCELAEELLQEDLTLLGTIKGLRREVPDAFKLEASKKREARSSKFLFAGPLTLVSYVPRKNKSVLLLSSMHHDSAINDTTSKPEMIHDYMHTKAGVDTIDQMCSVYNVARITRRWPMVVFYHIMNLAAINAYTLYGLKNPGWHPKGSARSAFLSQLAKELIHPQYMLRACNASRLARRTRTALEIVGYEIQHHRQPLPETDQLSHSRLKNGYCFLCEGGKGRTTKVCESCRRFACGKHTTTSRPVHNCHECLGCN